MTTSTLAQQTNWTTRVKAALSAAMLPTEVGESVVDNSRTADYNCGYNLGAYDVWRTVSSGQYDPLAIAPRRGTSQCALGWYAGLDAAHDVVRSVPMA